MNAAPPRPARASTAFTWFRVFLWSVPGLSAIPLFLGLETIHNALPWPDWTLAVGFLSTLSVLTVVSGCFDASLHLTRIHGRGNVQRAQLARFAGLFVMVQTLLLIPLVALLISALLWAALFRMP